MSEHNYMTYGDCETVLTGYANGITSTKNMITPVFDPATIYAVGDYCIYNNGLYKCTTAHTGAWSANDFTSVSVMDEIKNASGGGGLPETTKIVTFEYGVDDLSQPKIVTFPKYGDTGYGTIHINGRLFYKNGNNYNQHFFLGETTFYRQGSDLKFVEYAQSQSGSIPTITPCYGCKSNLQSFEVYNSTVGSLWVVLQQELSNYGKVNVFCPNTPNVVKAFVAITAIFA